MSLEKGSGGGAELKYDSTLNLQDSDKQVLHKLVVQMLLLKNGLKQLRGSEADENKDPK